MVLKMGSVTLLRHQLDSKHLFLKQKGSIALLTMEDGPKLGRHWWPVKLVKAYNGGADSPLGLNGSS